METKEHRVITDPAMQGLRYWVRSTLNHKMSRNIYFDTEATGLNCRTNKMVLIQMLNDVDELIVMDVRHWGTIEKRDFVAIMEPLSDYVLVGHNIGFDWQQLVYHYGIYWHRLYDTMVAQKVIDGARDESLRYGLGEVCERYDIPISKEERKWFYDLDTREAEWDMAIPIEEVQYASRDVQVLREIYPRQRVGINNAALGRTITLEMQSIVPLMKIEMKGLNVDEVEWRAFIARKQDEADIAESLCLETYGAAILSDRMHKYDEARAVYETWKCKRDVYLEALKHSYTEEVGWGEYKTRYMQAWRLVNPNPGTPKLGEDINVGSDAQMKVAFRTLGIPVPQRRDPATGKMKDSMRFEDLKPLEDMFPEVVPYLTLKKKQKLISTFGESFLSKKDVDDRIHTHFNQVISSGRVSSSDPNLQQIPARSDDGRELRRLIVAPYGYKIVVNDFSGIEDRIVCFLSGDTVNRRLYDEGLDVHSETAHLLFPEIDAALLRVPSDRFASRSYRDVAKTFRYAILYGAYPTRLSKNIGATLEDTTDLFTKFKETFAATFAWLDEAQREARTSGCTRTIGGRPRYAILPERPRLSRGDEYRESLRHYSTRVSAISRELANHKVQGTSADITKYTLCLLNARLGNAGDLLLVVHDEVLIECKDEHAEFCAKLLKQCMTEAVEHYMPGFPAGVEDASIEQYWKH